MMIKKRGNNKKRFKSRSGLKKSSSIAYLGKYIFISFVYTIKHINIKKKPILINFPMIDNITYIYE